MSFLKLCSFSEIAANLQSISFHHSYVNTGNLCLEIEI